MKNGADLLESRSDTFETRKAAAETQQEFWIDARRLPQATASTFYRKLDETLDSIGFAEGVREICLPTYADASRGGRPGPAIYQAAFELVLTGLRALVHRNTGK